VKIKNKLKIVNETEEGRDATLKVEKSGEKGPKMD